MRHRIGADLIDAMLAQFKALPELADVTIEDGPGELNEYGTYLYVGSDGRPPGETPAAAITVDREWPLATHTQMQDTGSIPLAIESWNGDADQAAARDEVYRVLDAILTHLRTQPANLGVLGVHSLMFTGERLIQGRESGGAGALLIFALTYQARI